MSLRGSARSAATATESTMTTLLLLPGLACDADLWRDQLPALAPQLARSHPGARIQVSDVHHRADSLPAMAALLLNEHPGDLLLAGCSLGGMLALETARQAPDRLRGLALLGTTARPDTPALIALRSQAIVQFEQGLVEPLIRANAMFAFHAANAPALTERYMAMILRAGAAGLIRQNRAVMARDDLRPHLARIACPTLVVGGLDDALTPPDCAREIAAALPQSQSQSQSQSQLHLLSECGHMLTWEQPQAVNQLLLAWLAGIPPRDAGAGSPQSGP